MRTLKNFLMTMILTAVSASASAQPMSYAAIQSNARFLTDRMAYTLGVRTSLLDDLYYINFDYIYGVNEYLDDIAWGYGIDEYNFVLARRDAALRELLSPAQYALYVTYDYFYRPIVFANNRWRFSIYAYDPRPGYFYFGLPHRYHRYHGGRFFAGIPAGTPRRMGPTPSPHTGHGGGPVIQPGRAGNDRGGGNHGGQNNGGNFNHGDYRGNNGNNAQAGGNNNRSNVSPGTASHGTSYTTGRGQSTSNTESATTTRSNQFNRSSNDRTPANANSSSRSSSTGRSVNAERVQRTRTESSRSSGSNTRSSNSSSSGRSGSYSSGRGGRR